jgi:UDP-N-acetyl-D-mannosaminuronic acid dehydrogenase
MANRHPRVNILTPGAGVGGHCIAVDPWFIVHSAPEQARMIRTAREVNDFKPEWVLQKILASIANHSLNKPTVACLGLAFKPDIDDLRESPALHIVNKLADAYDGKVLAVEPNVEETNKLNTKAQLVSLEQGLQADIIVMLVKHKAFAGMNVGDKVFINVVG